MVLAWALLDELPGAAQLVGGALVVAGSRRCAGASARTLGRSAISPPRGSRLRSRGCLGEGRRTNRASVIDVARCLPRRAARAASRVEARHHRRRLDP